MDDAPIVPTGTDPMLTVARDAPVPAPRVRLLPILVGLLIGLGLPWLPTERVLLPLIVRFGWKWATDWGAMILFHNALILIALPALVLFWERLPLSSIGIRRPTLSDLGLGLGAYTVLIVLNGIIAAAHGLFTPAAMHEFTKHGVSPLAPGQFAQLREIPLSLSLASAVANGFAEEMAARGFAIERLRTLTRSTMAAAVIALLLDLGAHLPFWGYRYALEIAPDQIVFVMLYLWQRRLGPCIVAHILLDVGPFLIMAAILAFPGAFGARAARDTQLLRVHPAAFERFDSRDRSGVSQEEFRWSPPMSWRMHISPSGLSRD